MSDKKKRNVPYSKPIVLKFMQDTQVAFDEFTKVVHSFDARLRAIEDFLDKTVNGDSKCETKSPLVLL